MYSVVSLPFMLCSNVVVHLSDHNRVMVAQVDYHIAQVDYHIGWFCAF